MKVGDRVKLTMQLGASPNAINCKDKKGTIIDKWGTYFLVKVGNDKKVVVHHMDLTLL